MAKAKMQPITTDPKCAALAMAKLIGHYYDATQTLNDEQSAAQKAGEGAHIALDRASTAAFRMCYVARQALALAPATSMAGAFAKIVAGIGVLDEADDAEDDLEKREFVHLAYALIEGGLEYFKREHGLTPEAVGVGAFFNGGNLPLNLIANPRAI